MKTGVMKRTALLLACASLAFWGTACSPKLIPGTQIEDTPDNRALMINMEQYRAALEAKDVRGLSLLIAPSFHDECGTPEPDDDLDSKNFVSKLSARVARMNDIRLELDVRRIDVQAMDNRASVIYYYTISFRSSTIGAHGERDSDLKQMSFTRASAKDPWKIASGV